MRFDQLVTVVRTTTNCYENRTLVIIVIFIILIITMTFGQSRCFECTAQDWADRIREHDGRATAVIGSLQVLR